MRRLLCGRTASILTIVLCLSGCQAFAGPNHSAVEGSPAVAGFWDGVSNGLLIAIEWLIDFLAPGHVAIYNSVNNGIRYETGYLIGIVVMAIAIHRLAAFALPHWPQRWRWERHRS
jgi:hypothetical protein